MSTGAVVMLVISAVVIWGGLAAALINLVRGGRRSPTARSGDAPEAHRDL